MAKLTRAQRADLILVALRDIFDSGRSVQWKTIVANLERVLPFKVTNWFEVRNVLQFMLDKSEVQRTKSVDVESYVKIFN